MQFNLAWGEKKLSWIATLHPDLHKFLNWLTAYRAFIGLKPQSFRTLTAQTL